MADPKDKLEKQESPSFPADTLGQHCRAHHARVGLQTTGDAAPASCRRAEHFDRSDRRRGSRPSGDVRRRSGNPDDGPRRQRRSCVQPLPYHSHVLADASRPADRPQSPPGRKRADRGVRQRLGRLFRKNPKKQRLGARGAQGLRLRHRRLGQMAQHARRGDHADRPVRELAHGSRLRVFLRLPGRRGFAIRAESRPQHDLRPSAENPGRGLPSQRRPGGRCDRMAAQAQGPPAGQAVFHVLGERRDPWAPSRREGVGGQVQGQVRRRLGRLPRARFRARQGEGLDPGRRAAYRAARDDAVLGQHPRGREALPAPPDGSGGGLLRTCRCPGRPGRRRDRQARLRRQYADPLHLGRQRLLGGRPERHDQRTLGAKRHSERHRSAHRRTR